MSHIFEPGDGVHVYSDVCAECGEHISEHAGPVPISAEHRTLSREWSTPTMRLSPFGMATCATCDSPDVTHAYDGSDDPHNREFIPQCTPCVQALRREFPSTFVVLYHAR